MKKMLNVLAVVLMLAGCSDFYNKPVLPSDGRGVVTINIGGGKNARTLLPGKEQFSNIYYELTFTDSNRETVPPKNGSAESVTVNLLPGEWTVDVKGFLSEEDSADESKAVVTGTKKFSVEAGKETSETVPLTLNAGKLPQNGEGKLAYSVTLPPGAAGSLKVLTLTTEAKQDSVDDLTANPNGEITLPSGLYHVTVSAEFDGKEKTWRELVQIYDNIVTKVEKVFKKNDFTASGLASAGISGFDTDIEDDYVIIDQAAKTITVFIPADASFTLTPDIAFNGAMIYPAPGEPMDFANSVNNPVWYTVCTESGAEKRYAVTVKILELTGIEIKNLPNKINDYKIGDSLSLDGLVLEAAYNNGTTEPIYSDNSELTIDPYDFSSSGTKPIIVRYRGMSDTFDVTVKAPVLQSITVTGPSKLNYYVNDILDLDGLVVTATYDYGSPKIIAHDKLTIDPYDFSTAGTKTITVKYDGKPATFTVTVKAPVVQSITVTGPSKLNYYVNDTLDLDGLVVTATYDYGSPKIIDNNELTIDPYDFSTAGPKTITVRYRGKSDTFDVTVTAPSGIILDEGDITITDEGRGVFDVESLVLSMSRGDQQEFTFNEPGCSVTQWYVGKIRLGNANSIILKARSFNVGKLTLTLEFTKGGKPWFANLNFTVTE